jgi:hypothetical protein
MVSWVLTLTLYLATGDVLVVQAPQPFEAYYECRQVGRVSLLANAQYHGAVAGHFMCEPQFDT